MSQAQAVKSFPGVRGRAPVSSGSERRAARDLDTSEHLRRRPPEVLPEVSWSGAPKGLTKRARRKFITRPLATALTEYAKLIRSPMEKHYRGWIYCAEDLPQAEGRLRPLKYCGGRGCLVCSSIRTARAWDGYKPTISEWKRKQFVTLTRRNVTDRELLDEIASMIRDVQRINEEMRDEDRVPLIALRKLECTYNIGENTFHPHFHFIVKTRQMARLLVARWMQICGDIDDDPNGRASKNAQKIIPANNRALAELFKYFTKLVVGRDKAKRIMPTPALHTIFGAMKGRRVYQPIGFKRITDDDDDDDESEIELKEGTPAFKRRDEEITWHWCQPLADWMDAETGECLTDYVPGDGFRAFVNSIR